MTFMITIVRFKKVGLLYSRVGAGAAGARVVSKIFPGAGAA
jgi:hypothetical protein